MLAGEANPVAPSAVVWMIRCRSLTRKACRKSRSRSPSPPTRSGLPHPGPPTGCRRGRRRSPAIPARGARRARWDTGSSSPDSVRSIRADPGVRGCPTGGAFRTGTRSRRRESEEPSATRPWPLRGVHVADDLRRGWREILAGVSGQDQVHAGPDRDKGIGVLHGEVGSAGSHRAGPAQVERVRLGDQVDGQPGGQHRDPEPLDSDRETAAAREPAELRYRPETAGRRAIRKTTTARTTSAASVAIRLRARAIPARSRRARPDRSGPPARRAECRATPGRDGRSERQMDGLFK